VTVLKTRFIAFGTLRGRWRQTRQRQRRGRQRLQ
jgi:hypothetical protein